MATTNFHAHAFYIKYYHGREIMFLPGFCMGVCLSVVRIPQKISKNDNAFWANLNGNWMGNKQCLS